MPLEEPRSVTSRQSLPASSLHCSRAPRPPRHTVGGVAVVAALVGVGVYLKMKPRGRRGRAQTSQAEGGVIGVTLSAPAQSFNENKI